MIHKESRSPQFLQTQGRDLRQASGLGNLSPLCKSFPRLGKRQVHLQLSIAVTGPTEPGIEGEAGGTTTRQLARCWSRHVSLPHARPCSESFPCIHSFILHNDHLQHYLYPDFIDNTPKRLCNLPKVSSRIVSGGAGI